MTNETTTNVETTTVEASAISLTEAQHQLFIAYAEDAPNWSGMPLVGGNVGSTSRSDKAHLTNMKKLGLIRTQSEEGNSWLMFTPLGIAYAARFGIDLSWVR